MPLGGDSRLVAWLLVLITIPLLSALGRPLQQWLSGYLSSLWLALLLSSLLFGALVYHLYLLWQRHRALPWWHLLWIVLIFVLLPMQLPYAEERLHFIVFGLFGFLSLRRFSLIVALLFAGMVSGLDELFQWWLPMRVGDWRDVAMNLLAALGGIGLAWLYDHWRPRIQA